MERHPFRSADEKSPVRRVIAGLHVLFLFVALGSAGFSAEAPKPRQAIEKPKRTALDRTRNSTDRVYVKFRDDSNVRLRDGRLTDLGVGALARTSHMFDCFSVSGLSWERQHKVSEERLSEMRETGQRNSGKAMPDLNTAYVLHLPAGADAAQVIDELNALDVVEIALPMPLPAPPPVA